MRSAAVALEGTVALRPHHISLATMVRRRIMGVTGLIILGLLILTAIVGPFLVPYDPKSIEFASLQSPSLQHPFGTDLLGRDVFARVVYGARISLGIGFAAVTIAAIGGSLLGAVSAFFGGWIDYLIQRVVEVVMAFPALILLVVLSGAYGASIKNVILILGIAAIPVMSRMVRSIVLSEKEQPYIEAARSSARAIVESCSSTCFLRFCRWRPSSPA